jgi:hypothetical protein
MGIYRPVSRRSINRIDIEDKMSNQIVLNGLNPEIFIDKGTVFLEMIEVQGSGTVDILDGKGNLIASGVVALSQDTSPLRCDYGVTLTGNITIAKGFVLEGIFNS